MLASERNALARAAPPFARHASALAVACLWAASHAAAADVQLESVTVTGSAQNPIGIADSAAAGTVSSQRLLARPALRPGDLLEATPGLVVSQHSGEGKANQFYLRGFNLDHGTDLRTTVDGVLVNQRSHGHGQGWTDLNFLIPELATGLRYKKGPYDASEGDFASAGAVDIGYATRLDQGLASVGLGQNGYRRVLLADSPAVGGGHLLYAVEALHHDGPFTRPDDYRKLNGVLRYARGDRSNGWNVTGMAYQGRWDATDQIPQRAVADGRLGRYDNVDPTDGGRSQRLALSGQWRRTDDARATSVVVSVVRTRLDLYSNFTYFLQRPVEGDQFGQFDRRTTTAVDARHAWQVPLGGRDSEMAMGLQFQHDAIDNALHDTRARETRAVVRSDRIHEASLGLWLQNTTTWLPWLRSVAGLRADGYRFAVRSDQPENSGSRRAAIVSPKLNLIAGPWARTEFYANAGSGFHSNDARGTVIARDPRSGDAVDRVSPLVRSTGAEVGMRSARVPGLLSTFSLYRLDFDSELVFVGDAGTTQAGRPSRRTGIEFNNDYRVSERLRIDADVAYARARFRDGSSADQRVPGAVEGVASLAIVAERIGPWSATLQARYFGPRPLLEDNSRRSRPSATLNARLGLRLAPHTQLQLEGYNLANRQVSAVDYAYRSRLPGEPAAGIVDTHSHPGEPRTFRIALVTRF